MRLAPLVIPPHATVDGVVDTPGDVAVQGRMEGEVRSGETVTVIADATCVADVLARVATIHGELIGNAICTEAIRVGPGARIVGNLRAPDIQIDADATVEGRIDLLPPEPRAAAIRQLPGELGSVAEQASAEVPTADLPLQRRRVPRPPRPRGRVRVTAKKEP